MPETDVNAEGTEAPDLANKSVAKAMGRLADPTAGVAAKVQPVLEGLAREINETVTFALTKGPTEYDLIAEACGLQGCIPLDGQTHAPLKRRHHRRGPRRFGEGRDRSLAGRDMARVGCPAAVGTTMSQARASPEPWIP